MEPPPPSSSQSTSIDLIDPLVARVWNFWFANQITQTNPNNTRALVNPNATTYKFHNTLWFNPGAHFVSHMRSQFEDRVVQAMRKELHPKCNTFPRGRLALILLLDQFARNIYRNTANEFASAALALELAQEAIALHLELELAPVEVLFLCMPLVHAEKLDTARVALDCVSQCISRCTYSNLKPVKGWRTGILNHIEVLQRFGRYPHRNADLGRANTPEEEAFLRNPDLSLLFVAHKKKERVEREHTALPEQLAPRLRILALHGFRQNGDMLRKGLRHLRRSCEAIAEFVFVTSPLSAVAENSSAEGYAAFQRAWWIANSDNTVYQGCVASLAYIEEIMKGQGPFDGVVGFSQGGALAALLAAMHPRFSMQFVICISAFASRAVAHLEYMRPGSIRVPSLHIYGKNDVMTIPERSRALFSMFDAATAKLVEHPSGHFTPQMWPYDAIVDFLKQFKPLKGPAMVSQLVSEPESLSPLPFATSLLCTDPPPQLDTLLQRVHELATQHRFAELLAVAEIVLSLNKGIPIPSVSTAPRFDPLVLDRILQRIIDKLCDQLRYDLRSAAAVLKQHPHYTQSSKPNDRPIDIDRLSLLVAAVNASDPDYHPARFDFLPVDSELNPSAVDMLDSWPSTLAQLAPRIGYRLDKVFRFARSVALALFPISQMTTFIQRVKLEGNSRENTVSTTPLALSTSTDYDADPDAELELTNPNADLLTLAKSLSYQRYSQTISLLCQLLANRSPTSIPTPQKSSQSVPHRVSELTLDLALEFLAEPIPGQVLDPEPVPVVPCSLQDLEPLLQHLRDNANVPFQTAFEKGTLTPDGRLDLCKQVVGPSGIRPLLDAMQHSNHVRRLLLGNNIISDSGAREIAEWIRHRGEQSSLDCWYIGGNRFGPEGMNQLCGVLETDKRVTALWLKRNPLRPTGMIPIAKMLQHNHTLQVLDLVNCGILDAGLQTLLDALMGPNANTTLRHLYVGTNGITAASGPLLEEFLSNFCKLESLYLGCNRLADLGVEHLAFGLAKNSHLHRLSLASNLIGPRGASALAQALIKHPSLELLDLGFLKATAAVGEHGNFVGDEGAAALAEMLLQNTKLAHLSVLHNYISQVGLNHLVHAMEQNRSITALPITQFGRTHNEFAKAALKASLDRNIAALSPSERARLSKLELPDHVNEIYSVYRTAD